MREKEVTLQLPPAHPRQYDLISAFERDPKLRFLIGACGTKFGKTYGCSIRLVKEAWDHFGSLNWWVAPSYDQSKNAYALVKRLLPKGTYDEKKADLTLILLQPDGSERSRVVFKSADNEDTLRGYGVNFFVLDEAARCSYESWVSIRTTTTQTMGRGIIISTPKGRGWFYDLFQLGDKTIVDDPSQDEYPEYWSIRMPTWANPFVPVESIRQMKRDMPEDVFRQEVAAEFLLESAGVFKGIKDCIKGILEPPQRGHNYVMGVDLGRLRDFTVLTVWDRERRHMVAYERFNQLDWSIQYHRIIELARQYRALCVMDSTGIGDPIVAAIVNSGVAVEPYKIGGSTAKQQLIEKLRVSIERQHISFPNVPILVRELQNYEYKVTTNGVVKYSAPSGFHDDCVISVALANTLLDIPPFKYKYRNVRGV